MTQLRFSILTGLSILVAVGLLLQVVLVHLAQLDTLRLSRSEAVIQQGRQCLAWLEQVAQRTNQLSQQDPALREVLARQKIQVKPPAAAAPAPAPAAAP